MNQVQQTTVSYDPGLLQYCAEHAWGAIRLYYKEPSTRELFNQVRPSVIRDVKRVFEGWGPVQLHGAWRQAKLRDRKYRASLKGKPNPTLRPWGSISVADKEGFRLFVSTVKKCRDEWEKAKQLSRTLTYSIVIDELGSNDLSGCDTLIRKLKESAAEQNKKDVDTERIKYCIDVARTTYGTFLQAIGRGRDYINYDHYVPRILSNDIGITEFSDTVYGMIFGDLCHNDRLNYSRVLFFAVRAAAQSFDRFQTAPSATPAPAGSTLRTWFKGKSVVIGEMSGEDLELLFNQTRQFSNCTVHSEIRKEKAFRASQLADKLDAHHEHQDRSASVHWTSKPTIAREDGAE